MKQRTDNQDGFPGTATAHSDASADPGVGPSPSISIRRSAMVGTANAATHVKCKVLLHTEKNRIMSTMCLYVFK